MTQSDGVPEWDLIDRLHKSMRIAHLSGPDLAEKLDVHRNTVTNYLSGRTPPDRRTLVTWAFVTGVPVDWLITGQQAPKNDGPTPGDPVTAWYVKELQPSDTRDIPQVTPTHPASPLDLEAA